MIILDDPIAFDWNEGNRDKNLIKHGISNKEAEEIFHNKPVKTFPDRKHSIKNETRYQAIGKTDDEKILFLSFTIRKEKVRIISARKADRKECEIYAKKEKV